MNGDRAAHGPLSTARLLVAQFDAQIAEFEGMNRAARRTPRGRDLASRIDELRAGHAEWTARVNELQPRKEDR